MEIIKFMFCCVPTQQRRKNRHILCVLTSQLCMVSYYNKNENAIIQFLLCAIVQKKYIYKKIQCMQHATFAFVYAVVVRLLSKCSSRNCNKSVIYVSIFLFNLANRTKDGKRIVDDEEMEMKRK